MWAARFFKTRAIAVRACELGRIEHGTANSGFAAAKPARAVHVGEMLKITSDSGKFEVEVLLVSETRGPASVAQTMYRETEQSRELRLKRAEERKVLAESEPLWERGHPSKRDRRRINWFRGRG